MLYATATLIGGTLLLGLTSYFIFVITGSVILATLVAGLIFADSLRSRRDDMTFIPTWLLREYISIGPRLILEGWPHVMRARRFARLDLETCTRVLTHLARRSVPTSRKELLILFPDVQWTRLTKDLQLLAGVIFFRPEGLRVILSMPLRLELRGWLSRSQSAGIPEPEPPSVSVTGPPKLSPAEILGVLPVASLDQIKTAYRSRIKECHPDRFASIDEYSRSLAEEWTKSLNAAYDFLTTQAQERKET